MVLTQGKIFGSQIDTVVSHRNQTIVASVLVDLDKQARPRPEATDCNFGYTMSPKESDRMRISGDPNQSRLPMHVCLNTLYCYSTKDFLGMAQYQNKTL